jgi:hypothetical protein
VLDPLGLYICSHKSISSFGRFLILFLFSVCRYGIGESVQGDGDGEDRAAMRREATSSQQEERQEQGETLQGGTRTLLFHFTRVFFCFVSMSTYDETDECSYDSDPVCLD